MQITHVINVEFSEYIEAVSECTSGGVYDFDTVGPTMKVQVFSKCSDNVNFDLVFMRIWDSNSVEVFSGETEKLLSEDPDEEGSILHTVRVSLSLDSIFGLQCAIEISDFIENLVSWIDPRSSLGNLDIKCAHSYGTGVVFSEQAAQCYMFRTIGQFEHGIKLTELGSRNELLDSILEVADFDTYSDIDLACVLYI